MFLQGAHEQMGLQINNPDKKQSDLAFEFAPGIVLVLHIQSDLK